MNNKYLIFRYTNYCWYSNYWEYTPVDLSDDLNIYFYAAKNDPRVFIKKEPIKDCMSYINLLRNIKGGETDPKNIGSKSIGEFFYEYGLLKFKTIFYFI
jgi:hypothetical protein